MPDYALMNQSLYEGKAADVEARHAELVRWLDKAVSHGSLHRNTVARRKSQAAKLVAGERETA